MDSLRPYQVSTVDWLDHHPRSILGSAPGLGKTLTVIRTTTDGPVLVVCALKDAMWTWEKEIPKWSDSSFMIYHGTPTYREKLDFSDSQYIITTPHMLPEVLERRKVWAGLVVDEAQYVKGRNIIAVKELRKIRSEKFFWVSGSPIVNSPADLWVPLNMIDRERFSSYWRWVFEHCIVDNSGFGNRIVGIKDYDHTRRSLEPYYYGVTKDEVSDQLPPKNRYAIYCELTPQQRKIYTELEGEMIALLQGGEYLLSPNVLSVQTRLQQVLISPELLPGWEGEAKSGSLELLHNRVVEDFANGQNVAVFTLFPSAIPIIERYLPPCQTFTVRGGKPNKADIKGFEEAMGPKALLCSIRSSASFDAYEATVGYFLEYDPTPAYNVQAEDRLHRLGQTKSVDIRYILNRNTVDERQMDVLDGKADWSDVLRTRS